MDYDFPETVGNGMSSSQLTRSPHIFQRGRSTTNQLYLVFLPGLDDGWMLRDMSLETCAHFGANIFRFWRQLKGRAAGNISV